MIILSYFFCFRKHYNLNFTVQISLNCNLKKTVFDEFQNLPLIFNVHHNLLNYDSLNVFKKLYFTSSFELEIIRYFLKSTSPKFINFKRIWIIPN